MMTHDRNSAATTSFRVPPADSVTAMALRVAARLAMRGDHSGAEQCRQLAASWAVSK